MKNEIMDNLRLTLEVIANTKAGLSIQELNKLQIPAYCELIRAEKDFAWRGQVVSADGMARREVAIPVRDINAGAVDLLLTTLETVFKELTPSTVTTPNCPVHPGIPLTSTDLPPLLNTLSPQYPSPEGEAKYPINDVPEDRHTWSE